MDLQSFDHWISYLVRNPCRFFTFMYKRLRLECFHFAVNVQGNLTPFWKTLLAYLALGSRMWGAHKLPLIRQDQHSITHMPLKFYSAISKPSFARVCETRNSSFNSSHSFGFASQKASLIVLRHIRNQLRSKPSVQTITWAGCNAGYNQLKAKKKYKTKQKTSFFSVQGGKLSILMFSRNLWGCPLQILHRKVFLRWAELP